LELCDQKFATVDRLRKLEGALAGISIRVFYYFHPLRYITGEGMVQRQLLFTHWPQLVPSLYKTNKGGEEVQTLVPLPATAYFIKLNYWCYSWGPWVNNRFKFRCLHPSALLLLHPDFPLFFEIFSFINTKFPLKIMFKNSWKKHVYGIACYWQLDLMFSLLSTLTGYFQSTQKCRETSPLERSKKGGNGWLIGTYYPKTFGQAFLIGFHFFYY
jgi:hypothetical protein